MSVNDVQQTLINYEIYVEGERHLGSGNVQLPELNYLTSELSGAGIAGKIEVPVRGHFENMEVKITWRTIFDRPIKLMNHTTVALSCRGAMQRYDAAKGIYKVIPVRVDLRTSPTSLNLGKLEPGEQTDTESTFVADYIKITVDGKTVFEHDKFNYVCNVNGEDMLAAVRDALGL